ncbi:MAG: nitrous oxide reductase family maturation protein NosD [Alphaproteobacteria bacterium]|nr:nitrous oxide reductase family maturation protein NosD [Alphaproteobacteria bacterium]
MKFFRSLPMVLCMCAWLGVPALAAVEVAPGGLAEAMAAAPPGEELRLSPGVHPGPIVIDRPLTLSGEAGAVLDGGGAGRVVTVKAADVTLRGFEIRNSGLSLSDMDSAVFLDRAAERAVVEGNRLTDNLIGVYVWGAKDALVKDNVIVGRRDLRMSERGDAVTVWNAPGARVIGNVVSHGRDGVLATTSRDNQFIGNSFSHLRFAVHFMHTNQSALIDNRARDVDVGWALMFSDRLEVRGNLVEDARDHGMALNFANNSVFEGNTVRRGGEKCFFIYNANKNVLRGNTFEDCEIGIHFTAAGARNTISGNAFIANRTQVKYVGTRLVEWSADGRGNYWSDNPAFDLNGDGIADAPYRPNDIVDQIVWAVPLAKLLLNSPAVQMVRWAQSRFPALMPGGVLDSAPLMRPPPTVTHGF